MAYRYNEKTGDFDDIPQDPNRRRNSQPSISDIPIIEDLNRVTTRQYTWSDSRVPNVPTRTSTDNTSTPPARVPQSHRSSNSSAGTVIINILVYAIVILLVATCG